MPLSNFPILETERLLLRQLSKDDANEIFILRSDEEHNKYVDRPRAETINDAHSFIEKINTLVSSGQSFFWAITIKRVPALIGTVCLWNMDLENKTAEMGYELLPAYQGKGIMTEAVTAVLNFAFNTFQFKQLSACPHPENKRSVGLLEQFGFKRDHEAEKQKPEDSIEAIYTLKAKDYLYT